MKILETIGLKKYYGAEPNVVRALDGVDFSVEDGEFVAVVGTSGSGKSTLLHMMGGLDTPTAGRVLVRGEDLSEKQDEALTIFRRRNIGFVFQSYNMVPILNVEENIVLPVELGGGRADSSFLENVVGILGLEDKLASMPHMLSGGQQQRVAIARALATSPEIIYFDEPTSALDPELTGEVLDVMRQLAAEGMTMLVVTHEMGFARDVSSHVIFMEDGHIIESASSAEFFANPRQERTRVFLSRIANR